MQKNEFYRLSPLNKQTYKAVRVHLESFEHKNQITYNKKLKNTTILQNANYNDNDTPIIKTNNKKPKKIKVKNKNIKNEKVKNENLKNKLLSSVYNFDILEAFLTQLNFKRINLLRKKLKQLKRRDSHIFYYIKKHKIAIMLKKHLFKNGLSLLKSLVSTRVKQHENSKNIKKFYTLLFK